MAGHRWPNEIRHDVARIVRDGARQIWLCDTVTDPEKAATDERYAIGFLAGVRDGVQVTGTALEGVARGLYDIAQRAEDHGEIEKAAEAMEEGDELAAVGGDLASWDPGLSIPEREVKEPENAFIVRMKRWIDETSSDATHVVCGVLHQ